MRSCIALRHVAFEDLGILGDLVAARGYGVRDLQAGVDDIDANEFVDGELAIILGGPIGVYETDAYPFLGAEIAAIRARLASGRPTLGICLGAQLMAAALGASVAPGSVKEIGYGPVTLSDAGRMSVLAALDGVRVLHWHGDNLELPEQAVRLARTPACPTQAFAIGANILGLQFHLEARPDQIEKWLIGHAVELAKAGSDPRDIRQQARDFGPSTLRAGTGIFSRWLDGISA
ncbi:glutamine amidotransferase [Roseiarcaceae bacterium H3SJ34-1]|uniref:glutamine amidotransferase n=1 Tax=Terripilifer ovatus TaxID=3032367 RepID=UPI003AB9555F|nr:glutamine amidotransferase [Roseiarcaceae bacterium H3SJ34-1]